MDYFVSITSEPYYFWQIHLLIESFKKFNLQDKLCIAICDLGKPIVSEFSQSLIDHPRKFTHADYSKDLPYNNYNKLGSLAWALKENLISQPFTIIHPDMVLVNPIDSMIENIVFSLEETNELSYINHKITQEIQIIKNAFPFEFPNWIPLGNIMTFNNVPTEFFYRTLEWVHILFEKYKLDIAENGVTFNIEKAAWILSIYEFVYKLTLNDYLKEDHLLSNDLSATHLIHYKHGIPPVFAKKYFTYKNIFIQPEETPYQRLIQNNVSEAVNYTIKLIS